MSAIQEVTSANFTAEVMESPVPVLVDLYADWCGPCRVMSQVLEGLLPQLEGKVKVVKVNTDEEPELAAAFRVEALPTVALMSGGKMVDGFVGLAPAKKVLAMIEKAGAGAAT
jgi:thioredoxin 1